MKSQIEKAYLHSTREITFQHARFTILRQMQIQVYLFLCHLLFLKNSTRARTHTHRDYGGSFLLTAHLPPAALDAEGLRMRRIFRLQLSQPKSNFKACYWKVLHQHFTWLLDLPFTNSSI